MIKICEICSQRYEINSSTKIYCYNCSGESTRKDNETRKHQKIRCIDALEFHHNNPREKEFKLGSGNTLSWKEYKAEVLKCILVCSNCHKEIHSRLGYKN